MGPPAQQSNLWSQPFYRVRKKVMALAGKYWIEDYQGNQIGFSKQKLMKLKEDIRIYTDDKMAQELFMIKQDGIVDAWGTFSIVDTPSGQCVGKLKRKALKSGFVADEWHLCDPTGQPYGRVFEETSKGLMRKFMPGGNLIPEKVILEIGGQPITEIKQQFKVVGDIWEVNCQAVPPQFDRRVLLSSMILMAMIERKRK